MKLPIHSSHIEISRDALINNYEFIRNFLSDQKRIISSVVKGNAYGHGIEQMVPVLQKDCSVSHFSVYSAYDALKVKKALISEATIMIMGDIDKDAIPWAVENNIEFFVYDMDTLFHLINITKTIRKKARIHLEVETGMNRTGFLLSNFKKCLQALKSNEESFEVKGICTHFAGAESIANHLRIKKQIAKFKKFRDVAETNGFKNVLYHTACSAAAIRFQNTRLDMVRIGILQYGFWPNQETYLSYLIKNKIETNPLQRIISWKSRIITIKSVKQGEFVGYGTNYFANEDKLIAVIPVGYADGYSRGLSNNARVLIQGQFAPITGIVNMNAISVDITLIPNAKIDDEVVLIGRQGENEVSVSSFSEFTDQLNYEVLARLPLDIPRTIV